MGERERSSDLAAVGLRGVARAAAARAAAETVAVFGGGAVSA